MAPVGVSHATVANLPTDLSNTTTSQRSSPQATGLSILFRRDGDVSYRPDSQHPSQDGLSQVGKSCPSTPSKLTTDRSLYVHRKKRSQCWLWLAVDSIFGKVLDFVCDSRSVKRAWGLFKQLKGFPTMGWGHARFDSRAKLKACLDAPVCI